jgi:NAD(P)H-hydrate epimerase
MKSITAEEMGKIERRAVEFGIPLLLLMENAGRAVAEAALRLKPKRVAVLAGTGNNGGDGFVAARHLLAAGVRTEVFLLGDPGAVIKEEAKRNLEILRKIRPDTFVSLPDAIDVLKIRRQLKKYDVIIDAMLGTGVKGELREPVRTAVRALNELTVPVVAVDVPTGVDPTTGRVGDNAVKATITVTFHAMKRGLLKAKEFAGEVVVTSIGIPNQHPKISPRKA